MKKKKPQFSKDLTPMGGTALMHDQVPQPGHPSTALFANDSDADDIMLGR